MRPNCPTCNSIQTKITAKQDYSDRGRIYKCKNCGHSFLLVLNNDVSQKKKGGCLWSMAKIIFIAIILLLILGWFFKNEVPQKNSKTTQTMNIASEPKKSVEKRNVIAENQPVHQSKPKQQSIENSQDMSATLSIKTMVRKAE